LIELITILGKQKIEEIYNLGFRNLSIAKLNRIIKYNEIKEDLKTNIPISEIAKKHNLSARAIYKLLHHL
jgi:hypothetical protein